MSRESPSTTKDHRRRDPADVVPLLREQAGYGSLVLFLGAGVAHDAGLPTWAELVAPLRERLGLEQALDPLDVADYFVESEEGGRSALEQQVRHSLRTPDGRREPARSGKLHRAIARVTAPVIFTTNFDQLTEEAIGAIQGVPPATIVDDREVGVIDETWGVTLVKLHGCVSLPRTMVLTRTDFEEYATRHRAMIAYLHALLATRTFLFVGFSLVDPNFRVIYRAIREALDGRARPAYALMPGEELTPLLQGWRRRGMEPLLFPRLEDISAFVEDLAESRPRTPPSPLASHLDGLDRALVEMARAAREAARATANADEEAEATLLR
ncbi:MAG TPA: SIR2 family protein, partial [Chloroflexota bacterium]